MNAFPNKLEAAVERFESSWDGVTVPDVIEFLPPEDDPAFSQIATELLCVDLERHWSTGHRRSVADYQRRFPKLLAQQELRTRLGFEEYRLRLRTGDSVSREEYARRLRIDVSHWPTAPDPPTQIVATEAFSRGVVTEMARIAGCSVTFPQVGQQFLDFVLLEQLSTCRSGAVFVARQLGLADRLVVVKISTLGSLSVESERLAKLQHPNVVPIFSLQASEGLQVVCMPFRGRHTLAHLLPLLDEGQPFGSIQSLLSDDGDAPALAKPISGHHEPTVMDPSSANDVKEHGRDHLPERLTPADFRGITRERFATWLMTQVASGLAHAHQRGILHRDLKPANILFSTDGQPVILDFNLSDGGITDRQASAIIGGTVPYMSPEQLHAVAHHGRVDSRSDIYSLGVILYELLSGDLPFHTPVGSVVNRISMALGDRHGPVPSVRARMPALSHAIDAIVQRCLASNPDERYQSAVELQQDLARHWRSLPLMHAPNRSIAETISKFVHRHRSLLVMAAVAVCLVAGLGWMTVTRGLAVAEIRRTASYRDLLDRLTRTRALLTVPQADDGLLLLAESNAIEAIETAKALSLSHRTRQESGNATGEDVRNAASTAEIEHLLAETVYRRAMLADTDTLRDLFLRRSRDYNSMSLQHDHQQRLSRLLFEQLARIETALGDFDAAGKATQRALAAGHKSEAADPLLILDLLALGQYEAASEQLERMRRKDPTNYLVRLASGIWYRQRREYNSAEAEFTACLNMEPSYVAAALHRGIARIKAARPDDHNEAPLSDAQRASLRGAVEDFSMALKSMPDLVAAWTNRGIAKMELGSFAEAAADFSNALAKSNPKLSRLYLLRRRARIELGQSDLAEEDLQLALATTPTDAEGWLERARARLENDLNGALNDLDAVLAKEPLHRKALQNKTHILHRMERYDEAIGTATAMLQLNNHDPIALTARAVLYAALGNRDLAAADALHAVQYDRSPRRLYEVARLLASTSRLHDEDGDTAVMLLRRAITADVTWARTASDDPQFAALAHREDFQELVSAAAVLDRN